jgi:hypothetical protein
MKKILVLMLFLPLGVTTYAQRIKIEQVKGAGVSKQGIFYALPKTVLVIEVEVTKTKLTAPDNANLCDALFGDCQKVLGQKPYATGTAFEITNITIGSKATPDAEQIYRVDIRRRWNVDKAIGFSLSSEGLIQGTEVTTTNKTFEIITTALTTIIDVAAQTRLLTLLAPDIKAASPEEIKIKKRIDYLIAKKEDLLTAIASTGPLETLKFKVEETDKLLAQELTKILGKKEVAKKVYRFELYNIPTTDTELLHLSTTNGIYLDLTNDHILNPTEFSNIKKEGTPLIVKVGDGVSEFGKKITASATVEPGKKGLAYRVPKEAKVTVSFNNKNEAIALVPIAQSGIVAYLPYKIDKANIEYYENLGWLKKVSVETNSISPDNIKKAGEVITNAHEKLSGKTEIEKLKEENELLEAKKKNKELKDSLAQ